MDRFEAMRTLVAAVDGGSLSAASRALGIPLPTVSRRVADLEALLGAPLVVRTSRRLLTTEAGAAYVAVARRLLEDLTEAERAASGEYRAPRGELLVTAPIRFGTLHVAPVVHAFLAAFPDVRVRLALSDDVVDLVAAQIDIAVRIGPLPDSRLMARRVGAIRWMIVASPAYLARRGTPRRIDEISGHDCIAFEGLVLDREWPFAVRGRPRTVAIAPRFSVNTADAVIDGAVAGLGLACVASYQAAAAMRAGTLVPVLEAYLPPPVPVHLLRAARSPPPLKLRAFIDYVAPRLARSLAEVAATIRTRAPEARKPATSRSRT
jgi:DNA-binding transcriptional LysR family regulator